MLARAVIITDPREVSVEDLALTTPGPRDIVVDIHHSGISTGTEKLFWSGDMPPFPGMGYPLVPGYEAVGEVVDAGLEADFKPGTRVFVPGAACYGPVRGLFGGAASRLVTSQDRAVKVDPSLGAEGALLALAATAFHALFGSHAELPDLIVGHGVFGRLLARICLAYGHQPKVWEIAPERTGGAQGYDVLHPDADEARDYSIILDASGNGAFLNNLIARLVRGGEVVLAGFYPAPLSFAFPPAFMREARIRVAAEWTPADMHATRDLIESDKLSLDGLITHRATPNAAAQAYETAFADPDCLKMILDWRAP